ncbi:MAG TPA: peptidoglycan DD-metalloendopeptidase family protein [Firmicutes bacterium]|nr:peptidoglycan DD-metalloendopeptidase family protein [Bacillota bacterium]
MLYTKFSDVAESGPDGGQCRIWAAFRARTAAILLICLALLVAPVAASDKLKDKQKQLESVNARITATRNQILKVRKQEKGVLAELDRIERALDASEARLKSLKGQLAATNRDIARAQRDLEAAQDDLAAKKRALSQRLSVFGSRLRALYMYGPLNYLELLLTARDFSDLVTRATMISRFLQQDVEIYQRVKEEAEAVRAQMVEIDRRKAVLLQKQEKLRKLNMEAAAEHQNLELRRKERAAVLARIQRERQNYEEALDELEAMSNELTRVIRELQAERARSGKGGVQWAGRFVWPVRGRISSDFGSRMHPILHKVRFHSGIDIAAPQGTPVVAVADGLVIYSGWLSGYGKTVILDHGGELSTLYGHNSVLLVSGGERVTQGQMIARVGATGLATGPHVHFEVREEGVPVSPWKWLR